MTDYIKREDAYSACCYETPECYMARKEIKALPSADVVPVVLCKDCVFGMADDSYSPSQYLCQHRWDDWNNWNSGNHYCSYGERKRDETI